MTALHREAAINLLSISRREACRTQVFVTFVPSVRHARREMSMTEGVIWIDCRLGPVAGERIGRVTGQCEASRQRSPLGGRAIRRAIMRVNPEQASKVKMRTPTRSKTGEGSMGREATDMGTCSVRRGNGDGTSERHLGQRGRSDRAEVAASTSPRVTARFGSRRGS